MKKKNIIKKSVSVVLSLILLLSVAPLSVFAAQEVYPTIYLRGTGEPIYDADGNKIFPLNADLGEVIKEAFIPCLEQLVFGFASENYEDYAQEFYNAMYPVYEDVKLDKNGEVTDSSYIEWDVYTAPIREFNGKQGIEDYRFRYDWRVSPIETAELLKIYIDRVLEATGKDKVNLVSRCYGSNVVATYLEMFYDHAAENVSGVVYYTSSVMGVTSATGAFAGEMSFDSAAVDNYVKYFVEYENVITDDVLGSLITSLVTLLDDVKVLGLLSDGIQLLIDEIENDLFPTILRDTLCSWPSYWAMVQPAYYEQARDFIFDGCKDEYAGLIEKTDYYYYNVQLNFEETARKLEEEGLIFYDIVKYNFPNYPIFQDGIFQSDGCTSVTIQSFGAEQAVYGEILSDEYIDSLESDKYLAPDLTIDATNALFRDRTWFIKDLYHHTFPNSVHNMILDILNNKLTIDSEGYPQYLQYVNDGDILCPVEAADEPLTPVQGTALASLIRFLTALFNIFTKLLNS